MSDNNGRVNGQSTGRAAGSGIRRDAGLYGLERYLFVQARREASLIADERIDPLHQVTRLQSFQRLMTSLPGATRHDFWRRLDVLQSADLQRLIAVGRGPGDAAAAVSAVGSVLQRSRDEAMQFHAEHPDGPPRQSAQARQEFAGRHLDALRRMAFQVVDMSRDVAPRLDLLQVIDEELAVLPPAMQYSVWGTQPMQEDALRTLVGDAPAAARNTVEAQLARIEHVRMMGVSLIARAVASSSSEDGADEGEEEYVSSPDADSVDGGARPPDYEVAYVILTDGEVAAVDRLAALETISASLEGADDDTRQEALWSAVELSSILRAGLSLCNDAAVGQQVHANAGPAALARFLDLVGSDGPVLDTRNLWMVELGILAERQEAADVGLSASIARASGTLRGYFPTTLTPGQRALRDDASESIVTAAREHSRRRPVAAADAERFALEDELPSLTGSAVHDVAVEYAAVAGDSSVDLRRRLAAFVVVHRCLERFSAEAQARIWNEQGAGLVQALEELAPDVVADVNSVADYNRLVPGAISRIEHGLPVSSVSLDGMLDDLPELRHLRPSDPRALNADSGAGLSRRQVHYAAGIFAEVERCIERDVADKEELKLQRARLDRLSRYGPLQMFLGRLSATAGTTIEPGRVMAALAQRRDLARRGGAALNAACQDDEVCGLVMALAENATGECGDRITFGLDQIECALQERQQTAPGADLQAVVDTGIQVFNAAQLDERAKQLAERSLDRDGNSLAREELEFALGFRVNARRRHPELLLGQQTTMLYGSGPFHVPGEVVDAAVTEVDGMDQERLMFLANYAPLHQRLQEVPLYEAQEAQRMELDEELDLIAQMTPPDYSKGAVGELVYNVVSEVRREARDASAAHLMLELLHSAGVEPSGTRLAAAARDRQEQALLVEEIQQFRQSGSWNNQVGDLAPLAVVQLPTWPAQRGLLIFNEGHGTFVRYDAQGETHGMAAVRAATGANDVVLMLSEPVPGGAHYDVGELVDDPRGPRVRRTSSIPGDGDCLINALLHAEPGLARGGNLRHQLVDHMLMEQNFERYRPFFSVHQQGMDPAQTATLLTQMCLPVDEVTRPAQVAAVARLLDALSEADLSERQRVLLDPEVTAGLIRMAVNEVLHPPAVDEKGKQKAGNAEPFATMVHLSLRDALVGATDAWVERAMTGQSGASVLRELATGRGHQTLRPLTNLVYWDIATQRLPQLLDEKVHTPTGRTVPLHKLLEREPVVGNYRLAYQRLRDQAQTHTQRALPQPRPVDEPTAATRLDRWSSQIQANVYPQQAYARVVQAAGREGEARMLKKEAIRHALHQKWDAQSREHFYDHCANNERCLAEYEKNNEQMRSRSAEIRSEDQDMKAALNKLRNLAQIEVLSVSSLEISEAASQRNRESKTQRGYRNLAMNQAPALPPVPAAPTQRPALSAAAPSLLRVPSDSQLPQVVAGHSTALPDIDRHALQSGAPAQAAPQPFIVPPGTSLEDRTVWVPAELHAGGERHRGRLELPLRENAPLPVLVLPAQPAAPAMPRTITGPASNDVACRASQPVARSQRTWASFTPRDVQQLPSGVALTFNRGRPTQMHALVPSQAFDTMTFHRNDGNRIEMRHVPPRDAIQDRGRDAGGPAGRDRGLTR